MQPNSAPDNSPEQSSQPPIHNPLAVMQEDERVICEIKRHPIGMLLVYVSTGIVLIVLAVLAFVVIPNTVDDSSSSVNTLAVLGFFIFLLLSLIFVFITNIVYWGNRWVITSDSITQFEQTSLFSKESSQLSLGNLEDAAAEKIGILATIFNFGTLKAETAGEREKFTLSFCPTPDVYAQKILAAREDFEQGHHGGKQAPYYTAQPLPVIPIDQQQPPDAPIQPQNPAQPGYGAYQQPDPNDVTIENPFGPQAQQ